MTTTLAPRPARPNPWDDVGWAVVMALLGPIADRSPDIAMTLLASADEVVAAGRAGWRRAASAVARP